VGGWRGGRAGRGGKFLWGRDSTQPTNTADSKEGRDFLCCRRGRICKGVRGGGGKRGRGGGTEK